MVTYEQLYHLDLSRLESAIEAWRTQIHHLESLDDAFTQDASKRFSQAGWNSLDLTSATAAGQIEDADKEITDAVTEAKGIHDILRDAHSRLQKNKADLHKLADAEAPDRGLVVSSTGHVEARNDTTQDLPNQDDPDNEEIRTLQKKKIQGFTRRLSKSLTTSARTRWEPSPGVVTPSSRWQNSSAISRGSMLEIPYCTAGSEKHGITSWAAPRRTLSREWPKRQV